MTAGEIEAALDDGGLIDGKSIALWLLWRRRGEGKKEEGRRE